MWIKCIKANTLQLQWWGNSVFLFLRLHEEAEGCAGGVSRWWSPFQIQPGAGVSPSAFIRFYLLPLILVADILSHSDTASVRAHTNTWCDVIGYSFSFLWFSVISRSRVLSHSTTFIDKCCGGDTPVASTLASDVSSCSADYSAGCFIPPPELWTLSLFSGLTPLTLLSVLCTFPTWHSSVWFF